VRHVGYERSTSALLSRPDDDGAASPTSPHPALACSQDVDTRLIAAETRCLICRSLLRDPAVVVPCLHRFCRSCIDEALRRRVNGVGQAAPCPACRAPVASRRSARDDPRYAALIAAVYGDLDEWEEGEHARVVAGRGGVGGGGVGGEGRGEPASTAPESASKRARIGDPEGPLLASAVGGAAVVASAAAAAVGGGAPEAQLGQALADAAAAARDADPEAARGQTNSASTSTVVRLVLEPGRGVPSTTGPIVVPAAPAIVTVADVQIGLDSLGLGGNDVMVELALPGAEGAVVDDADTLGGLAKDGEVKLVFRAWEG